MENYNSINEECISLRHKSLRAQKKIIKKENDWFDFTKDDLPNSSPRSQATHFKIKRSEMGYGFESNIKSAFVDITVEDMQRTRYLWALVQSWTSPIPAISSQPAFCANLSIIHAQVCLKSNFNSVIHSYTINSEVEIIFAINTFETIKVILI